MKPSLAEIPKRLCSASDTTSSCSSRSSQSKGRRECSLPPVSEMSNTYLSLGLSPDLSMRAMPLEPRRTYLPIRLFHRSYSAQAFASGRWAYIITCSAYGYLYSCAAVRRNAVQFCLLRVICSVVLSISCNMLCTVGTVIPPCRSRGSVQSVQIPHP